MDYPDIQFFMAALNERSGRWAALTDRINQMDALVNHRWTTVFPDDVTDVDLPMVSNIFSQHVEDLGHLFARSIPTVRCDPDRTGQTAKNEASTREHALLAYHDASELWAFREKYAQDMAAAGFTAIKVWPNMRSPASSRLPMFRRLDPRTVLPEPRWQPELATDDVMVTYTETIKRLESQFPEGTGGGDALREFESEIEEARLKRATTYGSVDLGKVVAGTPTEFRVMDYYCSTYIVRAVAYTPADAQSAQMGKILTQIENPTGICPVQIAARSAWCNDPMGQLDGSKGPIRAKNRFLRLLVDYMIRMIYSRQLVWGVQNPTARGPDTVQYALRPDAFIKNVGPESAAFQVFQILGILDSEARSTAMAPASREGVVNLNKATAAFLTQAQGQLVDLSHSMEEQFAVALQRANAAAFAQDEAWCNATKTITGTARGSRFRMTYNPRKDIGGDYSNRVEYGELSGIDKATQHIIMLQDFDRGLLPMDTFLEQSPFVRELKAARAALVTDQLDKAFLLGLALPDTPHEVRIHARALAEQGRSLGEIAAILEKEQGQPVLNPQALQQAGAGAAPTLATRPGLAGAAAPNLPPMALLRGLGR
ncbi:MAG TPA: hypothetical protein VGR13_04170 [Actinomycetota bacterium]|jgi:hypothetical protein|nr:hypothetical protein [Actinomycetota bacterium]